MHHLIAYMNTAHQVGEMLSFVMECLYACMSCGYTRIHYINSCYKPCMFLFTETLSIGMDLLLVLCDSELPG